mmetsp:Transcript_5731/g.21770  ORF Transcript_5731/g.21770 Transcript_5731/m.21770 type:complete len:472 (+) Transcript_5731:119-1534(+)
MTAPTCRCLSAVGPRSVASSSVAAQVPKLAAVRHVSCRAWPPLGRTPTPGAAPALGRRLSLLPCLCSTGGSAVEVVGTPRAFATEPSANGKAEAPTDGAVSSSAAAGSTDSSATESSNSSSGGGGGSSSSSSSSGDNAGGGGGARGAARAKLRVAAMWHAAVNGQSSRFFRPPPRLEASMLGSLMFWCWKQIAVRHVSGIAPEAREEGRFDDLEKDLAEAAPQCLRFLAEGLQVATSSPDGRRASAKMLQPPFLEANLGEQLGEMVGSLLDEGRTWQWELLDVGHAEVERVFLIIGGSRGGTVKRGPTDILFAFGQQFVLTRDQTKQFMDKEAGLQGRMSVLQELILCDLVLVADVRLKARQRSHLLPGPATSSVEPDAETGKEEETEAQEEKEEAPASKRSEDAGGSASEHREAEVEHVLRLEMQLKQERSYNDDGLPTVRASSWQIADWNGVCHGNHPALPRNGPPAPW